MRIRYAFFLSLLLTGQSACITLSDAREPAEKANQMMDVAHKVMNVFSKTDKIEALEDLIDDEAKIVLVINDKTYTRTKREYIDKLKYSLHNNIVWVRFKDLSFELVGNNKLKIKDTSIQKRNGLGPREQTAGLYTVTDKAEYIFDVKSDGPPKIVRLYHYYSKKHLDSL